MTESNARPSARRILFVTNAADLYGSNRSLLRLLPQLPRERFLPLVVLPEDGPLKPLLESTGVEVVVHRGLSVINRQVFRSWRLLPFFFQFPFSAVFLRRLIRRRHIDLVHTNSGVVISPALAARWAGVPHVWHIRDWFQEFRALWRPYARYILWGSRRVIAVSKPIAAQFPPDSRIIVINNGFSLAEFAVDKPALARQFRERYGLGEDFVVGCVGRIKQWRKGQEFLIQAAALLEKRGRRARYLIVGSPAPGNEIHLERLQQLIREQGLERSVVLTGELADPKPAYAAMEVFVLPSAQPEPFGGVVMEAMAMGVPVVATHIGGSVEQVAEGETGFLVPPADSAALADRIERLMADPLLRQRMGRAGPERIARHFSVEQMTGRIIQIYEEALGLDHRASA